MLEFKSLPHLQELFKTNEDCIKYLEDIEWKDGVKCKRCGHEKVYKCANGNYKCKSCRKQFNIKTGTIFQSTKIPMKTWFTLLFMVNSNNKMPNSSWISEVFGVTYKTAWLNAQKIRAIFKTEMLSETLQGEIEMDESIFYGKNKNKHYHKRHKLAGNGRGVIPGKRYGIFGMVERGGRAIMMRLNGLSCIDLEKPITKYIDKDSMLYTDSYDAYGIAAKGYKRMTVNHSKYQYVDGNNHTNTIEGIWGHMKNTIKGLNHWVSEKHFDLYGAQICWYRNTNHLTPSERFNYFFRWIDTVVSQKSINAGI